MSSPLVPSFLPQDAQTDAALPDPARILELRVNPSSVRLYPAPPLSVSNDTLAATALTPGTASLDIPSLCLLRGTLDDFLQYSRQEASKWLIDLAHDICDPAERRGSLLAWKEPEKQWRPVSPIDPLTASVYRYDLPTGITVGLSKISLRVRKSATTLSGQPGTMGDRVRRRDGMCWVTRMLSPLSNSHILPKRMGDHLGRLIFGKFTSFGASNLPPPASIYSEVFGVCLTSNLDRYFDTYDMGFRYVSPNIYECHVFTAQAGTVTIAGEASTTEMASMFPALHGHPARPPQPQHPDNPPPGLFRWHYLQCVLRKFAHNDYKSLANIAYSEMPIKMEGDSDDEGTDSEAEWPSKGFDLGRQVEDSLAEREERRHATAQWIAAS
ncbi:hypothetical protein B0H15DRAFT_191074 [Mycena belliarum]|uniref:Uncharacterized protein n=1 Tax=Mycena belliarum TaxID=1033014 RepID=A0AAD6XVT5_9AGAR|nr:hypothetical protein B0H15DRAFT_191074 [Mycena belliae]